MGVHRPNMRWRYPTTLADLIELLDWISKSRTVWIDENKSNIFFKKRLTLNPS